MSGYKNMTQNAVVDVLHGEEGQMAFRTFKDRSMAFGVDFIFKDGSRKGLWYTDFRAPELDIDRGIITLEGMKERVVIHGVNLVLLYRGLMIRMVGEIAECHTVAHMVQQVEANGETYIHRIEWEEN